MANREIEARLKMTAIDQASRVIDRVGNKIDAIGRKLEAVNRAEKAVRKAEQAEAAAAAAAEKRRMMVTGLAVAGMYVAGRTAKKAVTDFALLEREITRIGITADASDEQIKAVSSTIMKMAQDTATPLSDVYDGFDALVSAGRSWDEALAFLPSVVKTAQAAGAETRDIAATADSLGGSMQIAGDEMELAFDKLVKGGKLGKFELKDMARYLPSILPQMAALGYTGQEGLETTIALLQTMRLQTGTAGEAATNLEAVLGQIYAPETATAFMKQFKVDLPRSLALAKKNGIDPIMAFIKILKKVTGGDMEKLSKVLARKELRSGAMAIMQMFKEYEAYLDGVGNAAGSVQKDLNRVTATALADIDRLSNNWEGFLTSLGNTAVSIGVADEIEGLSKHLQDITNVMETWNSGEKSDQALNDMNVHQNETLYPGVAAYAEAYRKTSGGLEPPKDMILPFKGGFLDRFYLSDEKRKEIEKQGRVAGAAALTEAEVARREFDAYNARQYNSARGLTGSQTLSQPVRGAPMSGVLRGGVEPFGAKTFADGERYIPMNDPGIELPGSYPNSGLVLPGISGSMGELKAQLVGSMEDAKQEVLLSAEDMLKQLVTMIGNTPIPPIKIKLDGQTQLARVNPGVSMPDNQ